MAQIQRFTMAPRVLLLLHTTKAWSSGVLRGFMRRARSKGWTVLRCNAVYDLECLLREHAPDLVVVGPEYPSWPSTLRDVVSIAVNVDHSPAGVASVCLDEARISGLAFRHLVARGLKYVTTFRLDDAAFAVAREQTFRDQPSGSHVSVLPGFRGPEDPAAIQAWLSGLPKPCGVYACCDVWARIVAQYAWSTGMRVPEDLALIGVDNDCLECELIAPPLSSVAVPWRAMGEAVADLASRALTGQSIAGQRLVIQPLDVVSRRSTDGLAISDDLVRAAVVWIHENGDRRVSVPSVTAAVRAPRQRLERLFREHLGRTIMQEVRRTHVETAKRLLTTTSLPLLDIARRSGFSTPARLNQAFHLEVGVPPGDYRRRSCIVADDHDAE